MSFSKDDFTSWIEGLDLKYFSPDELLVKCEREGNEPPPKELWVNMEPTIILVDRLRDAIGRPIQITSAYRAPTYNRMINGAKRSQHLSYCALDIICRGIPTAEIASWLLVERRKRVFKGGVGKYASFVHVDTRGTNAYWEG